MKALAIYTDGRLAVCDSDLDAVYEVVGTALLDHASVRSVIAQEYPRHRFMLWVDDLGHTKGDLPPNMIATGLYNTGHVIVGNAVLVAADEYGNTVDLPQDLIDQFIVT